MSRAIKFRSGAFNYDVDAASAKAALICEDDSRTVQSGKDDADINVIVNRFMKTGVLPGSIIPPTFDSFDGVVDFQSAMNAVLAARREFMKLDAKVRARFGNDPQQFVEFCSNRENLEEMRKLGLAVPKVEAPPEVIQKVEVVNPPKV